MVLCASVNTFAAIVRCSVLTKWQVAELLSGKTFNWVLKCDTRRYRALDYAFSYRYVL